MKSLLITTLLTITSTQGHAALECFRVTETGKKAHFILVENQPKKGLATVYTDGGKDGQVLEYKEHSFYNRLSELLTDKVFFHPYFEYRVYEIDEVVESAQLVTEADTLPVECKNQKQTTGL